MPFPDLNLKQAWLIPSATALPNPNGTAPGWFVTPPVGGVVVALPGPPREMRPMWADHALPRLRDRGLGADVATRTFRLTGIGESQVAELLGEAILRAENPVVATYARAEAVDVRVSATGDGERTAAELVEAAAAVVLDHLGAYVWATGETTWSRAIGDRLGELGWRLAVRESGTRGQVGTLFGDVGWIAYLESVTDDDNGPSEDDTDGLLGQARRVRDRSGADVGVAVRARERGTDTAVSIAVVSPTGEHRQTRRAFLGGSLGRTRAALATAAVLFEALREDGG
jgi:nicotinamide-nucleotide amidase